MTQKSIQEGDAFAAVCGEKEPKGCVRVLGLGPTPQSVGTPGVKSCIPTIIQMEELAIRDVELAIEMHKLSSTTTHSGARTTTVGGKVST